MIYDLIKLKTFKLAILLCTFLFGAIQLGIAADLQDNLVTGTVVDQNDEPLVGVSISEKGTSNGTVTDMAGLFSLKTNAKDATLIISYIGYIKQEISLKGKTKIIVKLKEDAQLIDEVVVVGYGVKKKETLTGAVAAINNSEIITTKNENVQNMLTGKLPGVRVVQQSSEPGSFKNAFDIRGMGAPLIVIDGVPRESFDRMDANDIESVSVLKDGTAAIYGVRASNGVVLITTKKGKTGTVSLDYSGNFGWQNPTGSPSSVSAADWMVLKNERSMHNVDGGKRPYTQDDIDAYRNGTKVGTDWWDVVMRDVAPQTQHSISASGGTDKIEFFTSIGYMDQESFLQSKDLDYNRYNVRSNISFKVTTRLTLGLNLSGIMDQKNQPQTNADWIIRTFQRAAAIQPIYANNNPDYLQYAYIEGDHPLAMMTSDISGYQQFNNKWFQSSASASYDIPGIQGLRAKALFSYDYNNADNRNYNKAYSEYDYDAASNKYTARGRGGSNGNSVFKREFFSKQSTLYQLSLDYKHTFNKVHNVTGLFLIEGSEKQGDNFYAQREISLALDELFAGNSKNQVASMSSDKKDLYHLSRLGYVGSFAYDYKSKYLVDANFRYDGASLFIDDNRWGFFPSIALGWRVSSEDFWHNAGLDFINNFKLRGSYGEMGNDAALAYQFLRGYYYPAQGGKDNTAMQISNNRLPAGYFFNGEFINSVSSKGIPNLNITWEVAKTLDFGVDFELWNGLLGGAFDYYERDLSGIPTTRAESLPSVVGAELAQENLEGNLTRGMEFELSHRNVVGDFRYNLKGLFYFTRVMKTHDEKARAGNSYENWRNSNQNRYLNVNWGRGEDGRWQSYQDIANSNVYVGKGTLPGDYRYLDYNGDGRLSGLDDYPNAYEDSKSPFLNFSLMFGGEWKSFDLNMMFQGAALTNVKYVEQLREPMWGHDMSNALYYFMDRWHPVDPGVDPYDYNTQWVSGTQAYTGTVPDESSQFNMHDASYLRLKSLEFGYTLPFNLVRKAGIKNARVYVNGYNLLTFKNVELDPEHPNDSWGNLYPLNRTFSVGVNLKF